MKNKYTLWIWLFKGGMRHRYKIKEKKLGWDTQYSLISVKNELIDVGKGLPFNCGGLYVYNLTLT